MLLLGVMNGLAQGVVVEKKRKGERRRKSTSIPCMKKGNHRNSFTTSYLCKCSPKGQGR